MINLQYALCTSFCKMHKYLTHNIPHARPRVGYLSITSAVIIVVTGYVMLKNPAVHLAFGTWRSDHQSSLEKGARRSIQWAVIHEGAIIIVDIRT